MKKVRYSVDKVAVAHDYVANHEENYDDVIPTRAGLAIALNVSKSTVYMWAKTYDDFRACVDKLDAKHENMIIQGSLKGEYNNAAARVLLTKATAGDTDKVDQSVRQPMDPTNVIPLRKDMDNDEANKAYLDSIKQR